MCEKKKKTMLNIVQCGVRESVHHIKYSVHGMVQEMCTPCKINIVHGDLRVHIGLCIRYCMGRYT